MPETAINQGEQLQTLLALSINQKRNILVFWKFERIMDCDTAMFVADTLKEGYSGYNVVHADQIEEEWKEFLDAMLGHDQPSEAIAYLWNMLTESEKI